jgi:hypothetical protein
LYYVYFLWNRGSIILGALLWYNRSDDPISQPFNMKMSSRIV